MAQAAPAPSEPALARRGSTTTPTIPATGSPPRAGRVQAIDWLRGIVMVLMTVDHAGAKLDANHLHGDSAHGWVRGTLLPPGEFLTRWITHLCAPAFVLLAGAALALSLEKRAQQPGQTAFIVKRGLFIAALDPIWMSYWFIGYSFVILQVLYAIGLSLVAMAFLRRLPTVALVVGAIVIQLGGEWVGGLFARDFSAGGAGYVIGTLLFNQGPVLHSVKTICAYPLVPWLSMMMAGWALGRWLLATRQRPNSARAWPLLVIGVALLGLFAIVRGLDGYGNWGLHRDSMALLQWLHVAKYPPSLSYTALELGLSFVLLAGLMRLDDGRPRPLLGWLETLGATAFFFYILHVPLLEIAMRIGHVDRQTHGLAKTYVGAALTVLLLYPACRWYRGYKAAHPDGWTRYI
jgi:uncharacterized membrane protein